jgi:cell division protein FtsQ
MSIRLLQLLLKGCNDVLPKFTKIPSAALILTALFAGLVYLLAWSSIFTVSAITVKGAPTVETEATIVKISQLVPGQKLARVEPRAISHRISDLPWIKKVEISRNWIDGKVSILVTPRTPTAYFNGSTIDASGTIFTLPGYSGKDLPKVSASTPELGLSAISLFQGLPRTFRSQVLSLSAYNESNYSMQLSISGREVKILWGANEKSELKIQVIEALLALEENQNIRRIDVSAPHAPIVK